MEDQGNDKTSNYINLESCYQNFERLKMQPLISSFPSAQVRSHREGLYALDYKTEPQLKQPTWEHHHRYSFHHSHLQSNKEVLSENN